MRALRTKIHGDIHWEEVEQATTTAGSALVKPLAVARCDLDIAVAQGLFPGEILGTSARPRSSSPQPGTTSSSPSR
jgi:hypothetical protein